MEGVVEDSVAPMSDGPQVRVGFWEPGMPGYYPPEYFRFPYPRHRIEVMDAPEPAGANGHHAGERNSTESEGDSMNNEWDGLPKPGTRVRLTWSAYRKDALVTSVHLHEGREVRVELRFDGEEEFRSDGSFERLTGLEELEILSAAPDFGARAGLRPIPGPAIRPDSLREVPG